MPQAHINRWVLNPTSWDQVKPDDGLGISDLILTRRSGLRENVFEYFTTASPTPKISITTGQRTWLLPLPLLATYSRVFAHIAKDPSITSVTLTAVHHSTFSLFVEFLFTSTFRFRHTRVALANPGIDSFRNNESRGLQRAPWHIKALVESILLSHRLESRLFHNYAIALLFSQLQMKNVLGGYIWFLSTNLVDYCCQNDLAPMSFMIVAMLAARVFEGKDVGRGPDETYQNLWKWRPKLWAWYTDSIRSRQTEPHLPNFLVHEEEEEFQWSVINARSNEERRVKARKENAKKLGVGTLDPPYDWVQVPIIHKLDDLSIQNTTRESSTGLDTGESSEPQDRFDTDMENYIDPQQLLIRPTTPASGIGHRLPGFERWDWFTRASSWFGDSNSPGAESASTPINSVQDLDDYNEGQPN